MFEVMNNTIKLDLKLTYGSYEDRIATYNLIQTVPGIYENWEKPGRIQFKGRKEPVSAATSLLRWKKLNIRGKESNNLTEHIIVDELSKAQKEYEKIFAHIEKSYP